MVAYRRRDCPPFSQREPWRPQARHEEAHSPFRVAARSIQIETRAAPLTAVEQASATHCPTLARTTDAGVVVRRACRNRDHVRATSCPGQSLSRPCLRLRAPVTMSGKVVTRIDPAAAVPRRVVEISSAGFATDESERMLIQALISAQRKPASARAIAVTTILRTDFLSSRRRNLRDR